MKETYYKVMYDDGDEVFEIHPYEDEQYPFLKADEVYDDRKKRHAIAFAKMKGAFVIKVEEEKIYPN